MVRLELIVEVGQIINRAVFHIPFALVEVEDVEGTCYIYIYIYIVLLVWIALG